MNKSFVMGMVCLLGFAVAAQDVNVFVQGVAEPELGGRVTGSAVVAPSRSVTLAASPAKGWAFTAWQDGSQVARRVVPYAEAHANANAEGVAVYTATFLPIADLEKPVVTAVDGVVTGMVGVAFSLGIEYASASAATLATTKLPGGLALKNGVISGVPKKAETVTISLTAVNPAGRSEPVQVTIRILPLPLSAQGTFTGFFQREDVRVIESTETTNLVVAGTFNMKVSASGKMSAKVVTEKGTISFSAPSWAAFGKNQLMADLRASGKRSETLALTHDARYALDLYVEAAGGAFEGTDWEGLAQKNTFNAKGKIIPDEWSDTSQILYYISYCPINTALLDYEWDNSVTNWVLRPVPRLPIVSYNVALGNQEMTTLGGAENAPKGYGYLTFIMRTDGSVKFAGKMADGKAVSGATIALISSGFNLMIGPYYQASIPLYVPMYNKAGCMSGLVFTYSSSIFTQKSAYMYTFTDMPLLWTYPGKSPTANPPQTEDAFEARLTTLGSVYSPYMDLSTFYTQEVFTASAPDLSYTYQKGGHVDTVDAWADLLPYVPLITKPKMALPAGKAPVFKNGDYILDDVNPSRATFTLAQKTGVFKGKFNVYYDYTDENGATKLKTVSVKHEGVMLPFYGSVQAPNSSLPGGTGFYLMPDTWVDTANPSRPVPYKLNRSFSVELK